MLCRIRQTAFQQAICNNSCNNSCRRNGPLLNNAISGLDMARWAIKGRQAADCYGRASGGGNAQVIERVKSRLARGFRLLRFAYYGDSRH